MLTAIDSGGRLPISMANRSAQAGFPKVLLAACAGAAFGFQAWRLAELILAVPLPWYAAAWLFASPVLAGIGIGACAKGKWWQRGPAFGAIFSLPSLAGAYALGTRGPACAIACLTFYLSTGLLTALLADFLCRHRELPVVAAADGMDRPGGAGRAKTEPGGAKPVRQRLAESKALLEQLDAERENRGDPLFGILAEERIIWGELIELELQEVDEQVDRIREGAAGGLPPKCKSNPRGRSSHERNQP